MWSEFIFRKAPVNACHLTHYITFEIRCIRPEETLTKMLAIHSEMLLVQNCCIHLVNRNTFLESRLLAVYLAGHFRFWPHAKVKVRLTYLPHQNPAAMVCHCPVQCTEDIFKLRQQLELCRMAICRLHASLCTPGSWQDRMVCTDGKWYKWQMSNV